MSASHNLGVRVGRAIGWTSAQVVRRSEGLALATGDFGRGVAHGASTQYTATSLDILRARQTRQAAVIAELEAKTQPAPVAAPASNIIVTA